MNQIEVKVKHLSQGTHQVKINLDADIDTLKQELSKLTNIPAAEIKLIFKGKVLKKGDDTLKDLNIQNDSCLHMIHDKPKPTTPQNTNPFGTQNQTNTTAPPQNQQTPPNPFGNMGMPGMQGMPGMGGMDMNNPQLQAMMGIHK